MPGQEGPIGPLIGRTGVILVALDVLAGFVALPLAALTRHLVGEITFAAELGRMQLWLSAVASAILWPITLRVVDPGYPSVRLPARRTAAAALIWILVASGFIYLIDKELASRLIVLLAALIAFGTAVAVRSIVRGEASTNRSDALPRLSIEAERALARGEPISIDLTRIATVLTRPSVVFESNKIWIYPSTLGPSERLLKRCLDIVCSLAILVVAAIPMLVIALVILVVDGRPILYRDMRAGLFGRPYTMRKFRSMRSGADAERAALWSVNSTSGPAFKIVDDPRVTKVGRLIRRFSLDELPQLFDVLQGRMSLVGPRPAGLDELVRYEDRHRLRLTVRPGVTGLWQVRRRIDADFEQRMDDDLEYIRRWSPLLDLAIIVRSIGVMLSGRGV